MNAKHALIPFMEYSLLICQDINFQYNFYRFIEEPVRHTDFK